MDYIKHDQELIQALYKVICTDMQIRPLRLTFKAIKQSGSCSYSSKTKMPLSLNINLKTGSFGGVYILLHEVAHQLRLLTDKDSTHGSGFKKVEKQLQTKYLHCSIANKMYF